jgi:hypothetical protein
MPPSRRLAQSLLFHHAAPVHLPRPAFPQSLLAKSFSEKRKTMSKRTWSVCVGVCALALSTLCAVSLGAQESEVKEKPAMYSYIANWQIPRAQWGEMAKANGADKGILDKALADGTIVGYGNDEALVHQADGDTHDNWWSSTSMAGLIKVLDAFYAAGTVTSPALASATKHSDAILVSHYYNWHSGAYKTSYTHVGSYKLKADAPDDAVETVSKRIVVPLLEKMLASGAIREYEVDTEAIHTTSPDRFWIVYVASNPEGLDAVNAALAESVKANPFFGSAFGSMTDSSAHRDELIKGEGVFK